MAAGSEGKEEPEDRLSSAEKRRMQKAKEAEERRLERQKKALEEEIEALETDIKVLEQKVCLEENMTDHEKLAAISEALTGKRAALDEAYDRWLQLQE